jgi:hypothetical protein
MKAGEATLEKKPSVLQAKQVLKETFGSQAHPPDTVHLPWGGWGKVVPKEDGGYDILPIEQPQIDANAEFEAAVNEITRQELKVNTLAIMKKVAFTPSTVMSYAFLSEKTDEEGNSYFEGDIGDFCNYCVKFTLKFGFGVEFAIVTGKPTISDVFNATSNK